MPKAVKLCFFEIVQHSEMNSATLRNAGSSNETSNSEPHNILLTFWSISNLQKPGSENGYLGAQLWKISNVLERKCI